MYSGIKAAPPTAAPLCLLIRNSGGKPVGAASPPSSCRAPPWAEWMQDVTGLLMERRRYGAYRRLILRTIMHRGEKVSHRTCAWRGPLAARCRTLPDKWCRREAMKMFPSSRLCLPLISRVEMRGSAGCGKMHFSLITAYIPSATGGREGAALNDNEASGIQEG